MSANGAVETFEIERKYEVSEFACLPAHSEYPALALTANAPETIELTASYFDTPDAALGMQRVAVRRRVGGKDAGWHLKEKGAEGSRELVWPLEGGMPAGLRQEIVDRIGVAGVDRLVTVATMHTTRVITMLRDAAGVAVIELADDRVVATNVLTGAQLSWREWEAELAPAAAPTLLDLLEPLLLAAGATRVRGTSKLQRVLGRASDPA